jgi:hypothetical protein
VRVCGPAVSFAFSPPLPILLRLPGPVGRLERSLFVGETGKCTVRRLRAAEGILDIF